MESMIRDGAGLSGVTANYYEESVTGAVNGKWVRFPEGCKLSTVVFSTGTAKVQTTNAKVSDVEGDTVPVGAIVDWDNGAVVSGQSVIEVCSAYRLVGVSGDSDIYGYATKL